MIMGGVVPVVNVPGIAAGKLKLSGSTLADIFLGKITKWNDAAISEENPGTNLHQLSEQGFGCMERFGRQREIGQVAEWSWRQRE